MEYAHKSKYETTMHSNRLSYRSMPAMEVGPDTLLHGEEARCPYCGLARGIWWLLGAGAWEEVGLDVGLDSGCGAGKGLSGCAVRDWGGGCAVRGCPCRVFHAIRILDERSSNCDSDN